jgi:GNAT superfamily N-acetyltransferase
VRKGDFDVVHVHSPLPGSVARLAARTLSSARRPIVLTTEHNAASSYRWPTRVLNRWTSRWDAHTFAVSPEAAASVTDRRATVLTHGIDLEATRARLAQRHDMRATLGVDDDTVLVGTVANFREQKDYPNLLRACELLADRGVQYRLVAVGQGPLHREIESLRTELALSEYVRLLGYRADAVDVLAACDVFVLASAYEGLPVALMEATALGLPCVLTDVGGMRAALGDDGAKWVPPGSPDQLATALHTVLADGNLRQRLGAAATRSADAHFDGAASVATLRRWYLAESPEMPPPAVPPSGVLLRRASDADLPSILNLCRRTLGWDDRGDWEGLYRWKHLENSFGLSPAWVATTNDGRIVGLRVFLRWEFVCDGTRVHAVRAVDTATDPDFQGQGLFTALTLSALPALREAGFAMVFNTPNEQSRPGYLKMGWRDVGTLRPVVRPVGSRSVSRLMRSRVPADLWPEQLTVGRSVTEWLATDAAVVLAKDVSTAGVRTVISRDFVEWRFNSPLQPCRVVGHGSHVAVVQLRRRGRVRELVCMMSWGAQDAVDALLVQTAHDAGADVVLRLGPPALRRGFVGVRALGPRLTSVMLTDSPVPPLADWHLTMADVALF